MMLMMGSSRVQGNGGLKAFYSSRSAHRLAVAMVECSHRLALLKGGGRRRKRRGNGKK